MNTKREIRIDRAKTLAQEPGKGHNRRCPSTKGKAMRSRFALMLLGTTIVVAPAFAQTDKGAAGMWQGTVERNGAQAPMTLRLRQKKGHWKGRADVEGSASPLTKVQVQGNHVQFSLKGQGNFDGTISENSLVGKLSPSKKGRAPGSVSLTRQEESEQEMNAKIDAVIESEGP